MKGLTLLAEKVAVTSPASVHVLENELLCFRLPTRRARKPVLAGLEIGCVDYRPLQANGHGRHIRPQVVFGIRQRGKTG